MKALGREGISMSRVGVHKVITKFEELAMVTRKFGESHGNCQECSISER